MKIRICVAFDTLKNYLLDPEHLRAWTAHRTVFRQAGACYELRAVEGRLQPVAVSTAYEASGTHSGILRFIWQPGSTVGFLLEAAGGAAVDITPQIPESLPPDVRTRMQHIIGIELEVLKTMQEAGPRADIPPGHLLEIQKYHLSLYQTITAPRHNASLPQPAPF